MSISGELAISSHRSNQVKKVDNSFSSLKKAEMRDKFIKIIMPENETFLNLKVQH